MSKFKTTIPINVEEVKKLLPPGAYFDKAEYQNGHLEVHWEHDQFRTPYTFAMEFPIENLKRCEVPEGVKVRGDVAKINTQIGTNVPNSSEQPPENGEQTGVSTPEPVETAASSALDPSSAETQPAVPIPDASVPTAVENGTIVPLATEAPVENAGNVRTPAKKSAAAPRKRR